MELNITWNNGLHDAKQFWNFVRRLSYMDCQLKNLLFLTILVFYNHHDTGHAQKGHLQDPNEVILSLPWLQTVSKE